jgi:uncharacterized protein with von Willebrand factor type A (vWA) domain
MNDMATSLSHQSLMEAVIFFGRQLRDAGLKVTPARLEDALRGLPLIQIGERTQFRSVLRTNLVSSVEDLALFDAMMQNKGPGSMELMRGFWKRMRKAAGRRLEKRLPSAL